MRHIKLTKGKAALVDDEFYEYLMQWCWCYKASGGKDRGYAVRREEGKLIFMHRVIQELSNGPIPVGHVVDHRDGRPLNNTTQNLRAATRSQNLANKPPKANKKYSPYKGVSKHKASGLWVAVITVNAVVHLLGYFTTELEAAIAYNHAAIEYFGEFAWLNKLP